MLASFAWLRVALFHDALLTRHVHAHRPFKTRRLANKEGSSTVDELVTQIGSPALMFTQLAKWRAQWPQIAVIPTQLRAEDNRLPVSSFTLFPSFMLVQGEDVTINFISIRKGFIKRSLIPRFLTILPKVCYCRSGAILVVLYPLLYNFRERPFPFTGAMAGDFLYVLVQNMLKPEPPFFVWSRVPALMKGGGSRLIQTPELPGFCQIFK